MFIKNWKEELSKDEVYLCFSFPLFKFLESNQVYPIAKEIHRTTNKVFTVFIKNEKLQELLKPPIKKEKYHIISLILPPQQ